MFLRESNFDLETAINSLLIQDNVANSTPRDIVPDTEDQAQGQWYQFVLWITPRPYVD